MSDAEVVIPLNRGGESYTTQESEAVTDYFGNPFAEVSQSPEVILNYDALESTHSAFSNLQDLPVDELVDIFSTAGDYFTGDGYEEWVENVVRATGRTRSSAESAGEQLERSLKSMGAYLEAQAPLNDIEAYDSHFYHRSDGERVDFIPVARNVGVVSPSNHPVVQVLPMMGLAAKIPLIHRPSNEEPFTAHRLTESLYEAGLPDDVLYMLPGDKDLGREVVTSTDKGLIFGSDKTTKQYRNNDNVKTYGPGNSKMIVGRGFEDDAEALAVAEEGMMSDGGRGCINESQFVLFDRSREFSYNLAKRALNANIRDPMYSDAEVPAFKEDEAHQWNEFVEDYLEQEGVTDITEQLQPGRIVRQDGATFLRPTVIHIDYAEFDGGHPLFTELPFQYGAVTEIPSEELTSVIEGSLSVSLHTDDEEIVETVRMEPSVDKVHLGESSCNLDPSKPHQGYIVDHLYKEKEFSSAGVGREKRGRVIVSRLGGLVSI